jgi:hypothetical protein
MMTRSSEAVTWTLELTPDGVRCYNWKEKEWLTPEAARLEVYFDDRDDLTI